jgi:hypothetical protein
VKNYKCNNGIAYETRKTRQLDGRCCSGDGTVPYASLSYCRKWDRVPGLELKISELEKGEHRDILKDKRFVQQVCSVVEHIVQSLARRNDWRLAIGDWRLAIHTN